MTLLHAKQINAYMMLNSAFWHVFRDHKAAMAIVDARLALSLEMDGDTLLTAVALCQQREEIRRAA